MVDHFDGVVDKKLTGEQQDNTAYSLAFPLTQLLADHLDVLELPPYQLRRSTHPICDQKRSCALTWLRIRVGQTWMEKTLVINNLLIFNGTVPEGVIPFSSRESAAKAVEQLQSLSQNQCP